jgi:hypothetical protein
MPIARIVNIEIPGLVGCSRFDPAPSSPLPLAAGEQTWIMRLVAPECEMHPDANALTGATSQADVMSLAHARAVHELGPWLASGSPSDISALRGGWKYTRNNQPTKLQARLRVPTDLADQAELLAAFCRIFAGGDFGGANSLACERAERFSSDLLARFLDASTHAEAQVRAAAWRSCADRLLGSYLGAGGALGLNPKPNLAKFRELLSLSEAELHLTLTQGQWTLPWGHPWGIARGGPNSPYRRPPYDRTELETALDKLIAADFLEPAFYRKGQSANFRRTLREIAREEPSFNFHGADVNYWLADRWNRDHLSVFIGRIAGVRDFF